MIIEKYLAHTTDLTKSYFWKTVLASNSDKSELCKKILPKHTLQTTTMKKMFHNLLTEVYALCTEKVYALYTENT